MDLFGNISTVIVLLVLVELLAVIISDQKPMPVGEAP
jgi:hypothetical protein